jgi:hypothetical protein
MASRKDGSWSLSLRSALNLCACLLGLVDLEPRMTLSAFIGVRIGSYRSIGPLVPRRFHLAPRDVSESSGATRTKLNVRLRACTVCHW